MNLSTAAKMAVIPTAAVALLTMRWAVAHTFTLMIWVAVIAAMVYVASTAKAKKAEKTAAQPQAADQPAPVWTVPQDVPRQALPQAQPQVTDLYTAQRIHHTN